jgi:glucose/arabinose dehydrogenase
MLPEAWQMGLRNPWRFSFDRLTGDLWVGDVGQDAYEEVDTVQAGSNHVPGGGLNFGWSIMEGTHCYPETAQCDRTGLTLPILDYSHSGGDCSITGGYVYRGREYPALAGVYLYGDWCSGKIWGLAPDGRGGWQHRQLLATQLSLSSFGEDSTGELYAVDLNGTVYGIGAG